MSMKSNLCFNGAVTLSLQKSVQSHQYRFFVNGLQWSCNFIVTEISSNLTSNGLVTTLQWSCNFIVTEILRLASILEYANELQWSCNFIVTEILMMF